MTPVVYRIDAQDKIIFVNEEWDRFAAANGGEAVLSSRVLGRELWGFISDPTTAALYRTMVRRVREGKVIRLDIRCDSPERVRLLRLTAAAVPEVEIRVSPLADELRPRPLPPQTADSLLRSCSWCARIYHDGRWVDAEAAAAALRLFDRPAMPRLTHGICESCTAAVESRL